MSKFPYFVVSTLDGLESDEAKTGRSLKKESPLTSVVLHDVVLVRRMIAGTTGIAIRFAIDVETGKRELAAISHIQIEKYLIFFENRQRIVLVNVTWSAGRGADRIRGA